MQNNVCQLQFKNRLYQQLDVGAPDCCLVEGELNYTVPAGVDPQRRSVSKKYALEIWQTIQLFKKCWTRCR